MTIVHAVEFSRIGRTSPAGLLDRAARGASLAPKLYHRRLSRCVPVWEAVRPHFDDKELTDLTLLITSINSWNRFAIAFRKMPV